MSGIVSYYLPKTASLEKVNAARRQISALVGDYLPDVDVTPGSVTGDCVITPMAIGLSGVEEATDKLLSDLRLSQPARGVIYSCEFVESYLANFGVYDLALSPPRGVVRLTFSADLALVVNRNTFFNFGSDDVWRISVVNKASGNVSINPSTAVPDGNADNYYLRQIAIERWAVDLPVEASSFTAPVRKNSSATVSTIPANLVSAVAATDFRDGIGPRKLSDLARRAQHISASASMNTRAGIRSFFFQRWADSVMVSPVIAGDEASIEVVTSSPLALPRPTIDIFYRSGQDYQTLTERVKLRYVEVNSEFVFRGRLDLSWRPTELLGVTWAGDDGATSGWEVFSSSNGAREDFFGSRHETLWLSVAPVLDSNSLPLIVIDEDDDGPYAWFDVAFRADTSLPQVRGFVESADNVPPGVEVLVREPHVASVGLSCLIIRDKGAAINLTDLRNRIGAYFLSVGNPNALSLSQIHRIIQQLGARTVSVACLSSCSPSPASRLLRDVTDLVTLTQDWSADSDFIAATVTNDFSAILDFESHSVGESKWAKSAATTKVVLSNLEIQEIDA